MRIYVVPDRTTATLQNLIQRSCARGSHIHHDGFLSYSAVAWNRLGLRHTRHIHLQRGQIRRTFEHSNLIEGLWAVLKYYIKHTYSTLPGTAALEDFLFEAKFRRDIAMLPR
jgi:hypothetical protein